jgi:putrescine transport system substrate-binding protein
VPKSGSPAWFDFWSIPSDAKNPDGSHKFIDYLLRPEVIAACTNYTGYANSNAAATPFVDKDIAADPAVYPSGETMARLYAPPPSTEEQERALARVWTAIKTGG